jgi:hypothetical protein
MGGECGQGDTMNLSEPLNRHTGQASVTRAARENNDKYSKCNTYAVNADVPPPCPMPATVQKKCGPRRWIPTNFFSYFLHVSTNFLTVWEVVKKCVVPPGQALGVGQPGQGVGQGGGYLYQFQYLKILEMVASPNLMPFYCPNTIVPWPRRNGNVVVNKAKRVIPTRTTPQNTLLAGERLFKITLEGTDAKAKDNEKRIQKSGDVKQWSAGG